MEGKERTRGQRGAGRARAAGGARATHLGGQGRDAGGAAGGSWRCADAQNLQRRDEPQRSPPTARGLPGTPPAVRRRGAVARWVISAPGGPELAPCSKSLDISFACHGPVRHLVDRQFKYVNASGAAEVMV